MCNCYFTGGFGVDPGLIWLDYTKGKQTYKQLAETYSCSVRTIQRKLDQASVSILEKQPRRVVILMDTTYWGRGFGLMLFRDAYSKENLLRYYVKSESNYLYKKGIDELLSRGYDILGIVCDGRRGLLQLFFNIPVQMCQFHQVAIIRRYLTKKPRMQASIELMAHVLLLKKTDKESFKGGLELWYLKWESFLNERTINVQTGKGHYTHKRLRSAYRSLKSNMNWLFTWYEFYELEIPNTTNSIEGHFSDLKNKMRNHNGLTHKRKMKFIDEFLKA